MGQIVIYRDTPIERESWVKIVLDGKRYWIDPEAEVSRVVGTRISREGCIVSMVQGFLAAGHTAIMGSPTSRPYPFRPSYVYQPKLVYLLFGLAWVRGEWPELERQLAYIRPEFRLRVLEHTAQQYVGRRWIDRISLQIP